MLRPDEQRTPEGRAVTLGSNHRRGAAEPHPARKELNRERRTGAVSERLDVLLENMKAHGLSEDDYWWYIDLRRYGTVPHAGFGLGFERMLMFVTGIPNIRDVIPFPRTPGSAPF